MRQFGLPSVAPIPSSAHIVHFYQHGKDLLEVFAQFCWAGLQEGDCCLWVTTPPWTAGLALHELQRRLPSVDQYWSTGQLQLIAGEEFYLTGGVFDGEGALARFAACFREARTHGWSQLRVCGCPYNLSSEKQWSACLQYEQDIHRLVTEMDVLTLCGYRLGGVPVFARNGLIQSHHTMLVRHDDEWQYGPSTSG
jgi:hypothetical protein